MQESCTDKRTDVWSRDFMIQKISFELWPELDCGEKSIWVDYEQLLRPIFFIFWGSRFFFLNFFLKHHSVLTEKLHKIKVKKKMFFGGIIFFFSEKTFFFRAKNASVSAERYGTDYCWLYCDSNQSITLSTDQRYIFIFFLPITRIKNRPGSSKMAPRIFIFLMVLGANLI